EPGNEIFGPRPRGPEGAERDGSYDVAAQAQRYRQYRPESGEAGILPFALRRRRDVIQQRGQHDGTARAQLSEEPGELPRKGAARRRLDAWNRDRAEHDQLAAIEREFAEGAALEPEELDQPG